ncbi:MAG TPA: alpha-amylase family glycosyl hydrolase [Gaiellaceae bacterium]|nr:alpha-amylase family glycosyl hydrolase [Gaiellaceae bacterium]
MPAPAALGRPFGAAAVEGGVEFRVWAPNAARAVVRVGTRDHDLILAGAGVWEATVEAGAGDDYLYLLDGQAWPDPCSRFQPEGVRGPSQVVDPSRFSWTDAGWNGVALDELVVYELHVGTFSDQGTFDGVITYFDGLRELGVTAVELMPVATFPGERGWGYDGVYAYAPHPAYGGPDGLARLVDAAHAAGLGVLLDVVYNHVGPGSEAIDAFGPYFTSRFHTFWGDAINYAEDGVREWAIQNACMWVRDYHVDGLRLDATHAIFDERPQHVLAELAERVHAERPQALVISEAAVGDLRPIEAWGHDAQWADELHHHLHVLLTGERDGYYADYGSGAGLAEQFGRRPADRLVVCSQNHDQVGNRALGDRPAAGELAIRAAVLLFAPETPLLFMGEEYGERRPFQFFTDHIDPAIIEATCEGRRREFESFTAFSGEDIPDPQDAGTFRRSKLSHQGDPELRDLYRELISLRRDLPREAEARWDEGARTLAVRRGDVTLVADFAAKTAEIRRG